MARMVEPASLDRYADLALRVGVGLRPGQRLVVRAPIEAAPLARALGAAAYRLGAPYVTAMWSDPEIARLRFDLAPGTSVAFDFQAVAGGTEFEILGTTFFLQGVGLGAIDTGDIGVI